MSRLYMKALQTLLRFMLATVACGTIIWSVQSSSSWTLASFFAIVICALTTFFVASKARLTMSLRSLGILFTGQFLPAAAISLPSAWLLGKHFDIVPATVFIATFALLCCVMMQSGSRSLSVYFAQLSHHDELYYYLMGNGSSHHKALQYIEQRAIERSLLPMLTNVGRSLLGWTPASLFMLVITGVSAWTAAILWAAMMLLSLCCAVVSTHLTLWLVRRYMFDKYGRLLNNVCKTKP